MTYRWTRDNKNIINPNGSRLRQVDGNKSTVGCWADPDFDQWIVAVPGSAERTWGFEGSERDALDTAWAMERFLGPQGIKEYAEGN